MNLEPGRKMIEKLNREFPELKLLLDRPYRELTTLGVGGTLPLLAEPASEDELKKLLAFLSRRRIPFFILGGGSNLVGMDAPYPGVAIRLDKAAFGKIERDGELIRAGAAAKLPALAAFAAENGLHGFAPLACIPGSVGGALRMNASCRGTAIGELVKTLHGVRFDGSSWQADAQSLKWRYREGGVPADVVITGATFELGSGDPAAEKAAVEEERAKRRASEPAGRSAGCVFRNVSPDKPAGMLIDRCGLRGSKVGGVEVSEKHANYILNTSGEASEADFLRLARFVRRSVRERFGCELRPEVRFISQTSHRALVEDRDPETAAPSRPSPLLVGVCRWLGRALTALAALALALTGRNLWAAEPTFAAVAFAGALLLILSEPFCTLLKRMDRHE